MDKQQTMKRLVRRYRAEYVMYALMEQMAKEALREGDEGAHKAISRRAWCKSQFLLGMKTAAVVAFGISERDFMAAVNNTCEQAQRKGVRHAEDKT